MRFAGSAWGVVGALLMVAGCGDDGAGAGNAGGGAHQGAGGAGQGGSVDAGGSGPNGGSTSVGGSGGGVTLPDSVDVTLVPNSTGATRVNFAVPLQGGQLTDASLVRVVAGGVELARGTRALASYADGSIRSVQVQVDVDPTTASTLSVGFGEASSVGDLPLVPVSETLVDADGESGPRVWALLPAEWLSASGVAGPLSPESEAVGTPLAAWADRCDYAAFDTDQFISEGSATTRAVWLYDRGTAFYRGYARRGDLVPLESAYRESSMYRNLIVGEGTSARNGLPQGSGSDPKYQYAQNLALHYLLTGDDRFRESAEDMALGMTELWASPGYDGGADSWTERNAGFALLAYTWAAVVSDDESATLWAAADDAVTAYVAVQETYPAGYDDADARCFAHHGDAHDPEEGNPYFGCSPWMSAILADALDGYARARGGAQADVARTSLVKLGRILAREGSDEAGNPFYWMGVDTDQDAVDDYFEHIGESAYVVALAWHLDGQSDAALLDAANALVDKFGSDGEVGQLRSFNWQCRSAVMTPTLLEHRPG